MFKLAQNPNAIPDVMYTNCVQIRGMIVGWMHIYERGCVCGHVAFCVNDDGQMNKINMVVWYGNMWNDDDACTGYVREYVIVCWHGTHMNT